jgi:hypothetical protein
MESTVSFDGLSTESLGFHLVQLGGRARAGDGNYYLQIANGPITCF